MHQDVLVPAGALLWDTLIESFPRFISTPLSTEYGVFLFSCRETKTSDHTTTRVSNSSSCSNLPHSKPSYRVGCFLSIFYKKIALFLLTIVTKNRTIMESLFQHIHFNAFIRMCYTIGNGILGFYPCRIFGLCHCLSSSRER